MSSSQIQWSFIVPLFVVCFFGFSIQAQEQNQMNKKIEGQWQSLGLTCDISAPDPDLSPISLAPPPADLTNSALALMKRSLVYAQTTLNIQSDGSWDRQVDIGSVIPGILSMIIMDPSLMAPMKGVSSITILNLLFNLKVSGDSCILREHGTYSWHKLNAHNLIFYHPDNFLDNFLTLKFESKNPELDASTCFQDFYQTLENAAQAVMTPIQSQVFMQLIPPPTAMNIQNFYALVVGHIPVYPTNQYEWMVDVSGKEITQLHAYVENSVNDLHLDTCSKQATNFIRYTKIK